MRADRVEGTLIRLDLNEHNLTSPSGSTSRAYLFYKAITAENSLVAAVPAQD